MKSAFGTCLASSARQDCARWAVGVEGMVSCGGSASASGCGCFCMPHSEVLLSLSLCVCVSIMMKAFSCQEFAHMTRDLFLPNWLSLCPLHISASHILTATLDLMCDQKGVLPFPLFVGVTGNCGSAS